MTDRLWETKLKRLKRGSKARVLDLFSGCGGLSLGFQAAGYGLPGSLQDEKCAVSIVAGVEKNSEASRTFATNFMSRQLGEIDISCLEPEELATKLGSSDPENMIDIIVGGPPCQAFSRIGRAKLQKNAASPVAHLEDERTDLYLRYLHWVERLRPLALLMENVPEMMNHGGKNYAAIACEALENMGYNCGYTLLNAVHYGVPQMRARMFLIAWAKEINLPVWFPPAVNYHELPDGYIDAEQAALKLARDSKCRYLVNMNHQQAGLLPSITAEIALSGLPEINWHRSIQIPDGRKFPIQPLKPESMLPYPGDSFEKYESLMRYWPGFSTQGESDWHIMRWLKRDFDIFEKMKPGDQYPEALKVANILFQERLSELNQNGIILNPEDSAYKQLLKDIVPPYDVNKFPNKWRKLEANQPARTLMAHLGKDSYSHIHYSDSQARTITVREAARLQSFPDGFKFIGSMNAAFKQIGNAVPPLLAWHLGRHLLNVLRTGTQTSVSDMQKLLSA